MQKVYKEKQIEVVSKKLNLPRTTVKSIVEEYCDYLKRELGNSRTVKVLNICYLRIKDEDGNSERKTLAYISYEIGQKLNIGGLTVQRVLTFLEDQVVSDLRKGIGFTLRGLVRIQTTEEDGYTRLRIRKATCYNAAPVYVSTIGSFRRRVLGGG